MDANVSGTSSARVTLPAKTRARLAREGRPLPDAIALLSRSDVARALGISPLTVYRMTRDGLLPSLKLGDGGLRAPRRYKAADIAAFIESRLSNSATE